MTATRFRNPSGLPAAVFVDAANPTSRHRSGGSAFWRCCALENVRLQSSMTPIWKSEKLSTHQWLLKNHLKLTHRTRRLLEDTLQMFHRLRQRIRLRTGRRIFSLTQPTAQYIQAPSHPREQLIERLQRKGQPQLLHGCLNGSAWQQLLQQSPEIRRPHRMPRQYCGQEHRKGFPAPATLPTIGAKHPLPTLGLSPRLSRVVAIQLAVTI